MHKVLPLNDAAGALPPPILTSAGFTAGSGFDLLCRGRLPVTLRRLRDGACAAPSRTLRVAVAPAGSLSRREARIALENPADSPTPVFELRPPPASCALSVVSLLALAASVPVLAYGLAMAFAVPVGLKVVSIQYGGAVSGDHLAVIRDVANERGMLELKDEDETASRRFFDRIKELKAERGVR